MKFLRSNKGFSLMEGLTVVAVMGILATMAVTNFDRLQRQKRKSEAKYQLGVLHTRMTSFEIEWQSYYGRFRDIGYAPSGSLMYDIGFLNDPAAPAGYTAVGGAGEVNTRAACGNDVINCSVVEAPNLTQFGPQGAFTWTANSFVAGAEGNIGGANTDQWSINELKDQLLNVRDGAL